MLAGLAAQSLVGGADQVVWAFATSAVVFGGLLVIASVTVTLASNAALRPLRMAGPGIKRWGGFVLGAVGAWFVLLALLPSPLFAV